MEVQFQLYSIFLVCFQKHAVYRNINFNCQSLLDTSFWSVNSMSLVFKLCRIFLTFQVMFQVLSFMKSLIRTIMYLFSFLWSMNCTSLVCKFFILLMKLLIRKVISQFHNQKDKFRLLVKFQLFFFLSAHCTSQFCIS